MSRPKKNEAKEPEQPTVTVRTESTTTVEFSLEQVEALLVAEARRITGCVSNPKIDHSCGYDGYYGSSVEFTEVS
jgi:hypothetical protein